MSNRSAVLMLRITTVAVLAMVQRGDSHTRNFCEFIETQRFPEIGLEPSDGRRLGESCRGGGLGCGSPLLKSNLRDGEQGPRHRFASAVEAHPPEVAHGVQNRVSLLGRLLMARRNGSLLLVTRATTKLPSIAVMASSARSRASEGGSPHSCANLAKASIQ